MRQYPSYMKNNPHNSFLKPYLEPHFLICACILAVLAAVLPLMEYAFGLYLRKEPLPLQNNLDLLEDALNGHYRLMNKELLSEDIEKTLGADNYIQWLLEDVNEPASSAVKYCMLFITYYSQPDNVPHVPEICYIGGGNVIKGTDDASFPVKNANSNRPISIRYLTFENTEGPFAMRREFGLCYLIYSNQTYTGTREGARLALNKNIFKKYSYFSKVEWKFFGSSSFSATVYPEKKDVLRASSKLLGVILPELEQKYWPDTDVKPADSKG